MAGAIYISVQFTVIPQILFIYNLIFTDMKTKISFLEFIAASILFGIGAENDSLLILLAGLFFIILTVTNEVINSKTANNENN